MRTILVLSLMLSHAAFAAQNTCDKYSNKVRYMNAIEAVASYLQIDLQSMCTSQKILDVEAQPHRVINRQGQVIPHMRVQLHYSYDSCYFMVRDEDLAITDQRCYSGF